MQNFKTSKNTAYQLYDVLRGQDSLEVNGVTALKMTVIYYLSLHNKLPEDIKLNVSIAENKDKWLALLNGLKNSTDIQLKRVFANNTALDKLPMQLVSELIQILLNVSEQDINQLVRELTISMIASQSKMDGYYAHISLYDLAAAILGNVQNKSVYIASPATSPLCTIISEQNGKVSYETINADLIIADMLSLTSSDRFNVSYANQLLSPSYVDAKNQLQLFDYGVSFSPMGVRFSSKDANNDHYGRYEVIPKKVETADILHLIKQCSDKVITTVSEGVLFSTMEEPVRQYLIDRGMVKAVVSLPSNIWTSTGIKTSMLIIEPKGGNNQVRFVDLSESEFVDKTTNRWLVGLKDIEGILAQIESSEETECAVTVEQQSIIDNDYSLYSSAYVLSPEEKKVKSIIAKSETIDLDRLVRFERGLPFNADEGDCTVLEVGASEIEDIGDIATPTKEVSISESVRVKNQAGFLQPNDIIMILKGSAGKLGIVPENVPTTGDKRWMVNKSGIVIRVISSSIDPRALYAYLKSDFGTVQISRLIKGAAISNISLKELKQLPVIVPSKQEQEEAITCIDKSRETQQTIQQLLLDQEARQSKLWNL